MSPLIALRCIRATSFRESEAGANYAICYYGLGEGTIARIDAGECMRSMTEARARELEGLGHQ